MTRLLHHALRPRARAASSLLLLGLLPVVARAQHVHTPGMTHPGAAAPAPTVLPTQPGEGAFAAIAEVVALLEADPGTDWSRVRIDRLRDHLADMHRVTVEARVAARDVPGGAAFTVTGTGATVGAIRRMAVAHGGMVNGAGGVRVSTIVVPSGARVTVVAAVPADAREVARLRALGFHGFLTLENHHVRHHLALARGEAMPDHTGHAGHPASVPPR